MKSNILKPKWLDYIKGHLADDPFSLSLSSGNCEDPEWKEAILQIQSRQKALKKLPSFATDFRLIFPPPVSVEQTTSEEVAKFKSKIVKGDTLADLTGGMGIDSYFFSQQFEQVLYVEKDPNLFELAQYNFKTLGRKNISYIHSTAEDFLRSNTKKFDVIYLDPSRRSDENKRVFKLDEYSPNVMELEEGLVKAAKKALLKISPFADIQYLFSQLKYVSKIWIISLKNECKEILCELVKMNINPKIIETINLLDNEKVERHIVEPGKEKEFSVEYEFPRKFLYEPNVSILKSGAFKQICGHFQLAKLHQHTHLYTSDYLKEFPGRIFKIKHMVKPNRKEIEKVASPKKVNVIARNFPLKPEEILKKFKLKNGGRNYLIAATLCDNSKAFLICERIK